MPRLTDVCKFVVLALHQYEKHKQYAALFYSCFVFSAAFDGVDDPYPSLSDFHDYEPNLEFDDSDLLNQQHPENEEGKSTIPNQFPVVQVLH